MAGGFDVIQSGDSIETMVKRYEAMGGTRLLSAMKTSINAGAAEVRKEARRRMPVDTSHLKKSLGNVARQYKNNGVVVAYVGAKTKQRGFYARNDGGGVQVRVATRYAHLIEGGFKDRGGDEHKGKHVLERSGIASASKQFAAINAKMNQQIKKVVAKVKTIK